MADESQYDDLLRAGDDLADSGQIEEAKGLYQEGLRLAQEAGDQAFVHCFRGSLGEITGNYQQYIEEIEAGYRLAKDSYVLSTEMGTSLANQNRHSEALAYYEHGLRLRPGYVPALRSHAAVLAATARIPEALNEAETALALKPDDWRSLVVWANALRRADRLSEALSVVEKALSIRPRSVLVLTHKAATLFDGGDRATGLNLVEDALKLDPTGPQLLVYKGVLLSVMGRHDEALQTLEESLRLWPGNFAGRYARAVALANLKRKDEALSVFRELAKERPDDGAVKRWLFRLEKRPRRVVELEEQFRQEEQRRRAEEGEREIKLDAWRRLSGRSAHRIGNQLFAAKGALRVLAQNGNPAISESITDLQACLDRIGRICSEFRRFNANQPPKWQKTDAPVLLRDIFRRYGKGAEGLQFREEVAPLLPECLWDPQQIEQALGELLENAIRHSPAGATIQMKADPLEVGGRQWVRIAVTNEGDGVPLQYKVRIFDPFFSLRPGGTGLGLAIVSQIIKNHGGTIRETGQPGRFARFEVDLPAAAAKERTP